MVSRNNGRRMGGWMGLALVGAAVTATLAQQNSNQMGGGQGFARPMPVSGGGLGGMPRPISGIVGAPITLPGPIPGIVGSRIALPGLIGAGISRPAFQGSTSHVDNPEIFVHTGTMGGGSPFDGSGLFVNGSFGGDQSRLHIHIGGPDLVHFHHHHDHSIFAVAPFFAGPWYNSGYGYSDPYGSGYGYYPMDPSMYGAPPMALPSQPPVTEHVTPSTQKELGATYLAAGDPRAAVSVLRTWARDHSTDAEAMRLLGLALVEAGEVQEGVSTISLAYHTDPALAASPIPAAVFVDAARAREDVRHASVYANRVNSGSAWLAVAVLMQAEGREVTARSMVERAKRAGLEPEIAETMLASLR